MNKRNKVLLVILVGLFAFAIGEPLVNVVSNHKFQHQLDTNESSN